MRKAAFRICENKGADQLGGYYRPADQCLCFPYIDTSSSISLLPKSKISSHSLAIFHGCTPRFVSDLVGNPNDMFSNDAAHFIAELAKRSIEWICDLFQFL